MKLVHAADLHLDSPLRGLRHYEGAPTQEVRMATRRAFARLVDFCLTEQVAYLLIAGDLYDGDFKDYATALYFVEQVARLRESGTKVIWLRGNHDAANKMTRHLQVAEHVHELSVEQPASLLFEQHGLAFHGQGYAVRDVQEDLSARYPAPVPGMLNVGLLHTALDGRPGHASYAPASLNGLLSHGYDYWALGHVHQREVLAERPWVVFPGNLQGRHIREVGEKGCTLITISDGQIAHVEPIVLDEVRWVESDVKLDPAAHWDDVLESCQAALGRARLSAGGRTVATRLRLVGPSAAHGQLHQARDRIENEVRAMCVDFGDVYLEDVEFKTSGLLAAGELAERRDALGELFRAFSGPEQDEDARAALWEELLRPLSAISQDLLRDDSVDRDDILREAEQLLQGRLLFGEDQS